MHYMTVVSLEMSDEPHFVHFGSGHGLMSQKQFSHLEDYYLLLLCWIKNLIPLANIFIYVLLIIDYLYSTLDI